MSAVIVLNLCHGLIPLVVTPLPFNVRRLCPCGVRKAVRYGCTGVVAASTYRNAAIVELPLTYSL